MRAQKFLLAIGCMLLLSTFAASAQSKTTSPDGVPLAEMPPKNDPNVVRVPPPPDTHDGPVRVSGGIATGHIIRPIAVPVYPELAKRQGITGAVVLHAIIGKDGKIQQLQAISGPDVLRQAALDAVKHWRYKPYLLNGEATEIDTTITVNFDLNNRRR